MAWTQFGKACEVRNDIEESIREIVLHPEVYNDTYTEAKKARKQWELIEHCVSGLESGQRHYKENEDGRFYTIDGRRGSWREGWPEDKKIEILVAMRFFEWYFKEQGRVPRGSGMGPEDMQQP
jgi:hypothetical protein